LKAQAHHYLLLQGLDVLLEVEKQERDDGASEREAWQQQADGELDDRNRGIIPRSFFLLYHSQFEIHMKGWAMSFLVSRSL
jgi:hypothetical protein